MATVRCRQQARQTDSCLPRLLDKRTCFGSSVPLKPPILSSRNISDLLCRFILEIVRPCQIDSRSLSLPPRHRNMPLTERDINIPHITRTHTQTPPTRKTSQQHSKLPRFVSTPTSAPAAAKWTSRFADQTSSVERTASAMRRTPTQQRDLAGAESSQKVSQLSFMPSSTDLSRHQNCIGLAQTSHCRTTRRSLHAQSPVSRRSQALARTAAPSLTPANSHCNSSQSQGRSTSGHLSSLCLLALPAPLHQAWLRRLRRLRKIHPLRHRPRVQALSWPQRPSSLTPSWRRTHAQIEPASQVLSRWRLRTSAQRSTARKWHPATSHPESR